LWLNGKLFLVATALVCITFQSLASSVASVPHNCKQYGLLLWYCPSEVLPIRKWKETVRKLTRIPHQLALRSIQWAHETLVSLDSVTVSYKLFSEEAFLLISGNIASTCNITSSLSWLNRAWSRPKLTAIVATLSDTTVFVKLAARR